MAGAIAGALEKGSAPRSGGPPQPSAESWTSPTLRRFGGEQIDQVGGEHGGGGRGDAQPDGARLAVGDAADGGLGGGGLVEDDLGAGEQFGAGAGQGDLAGGAGEQRRAQFALQAADQVAERRRGDVQPLGGPTEAQFGGDCHERFELAQLHILTVPRRAGGRPEEARLAARLFGLAE